MDKMLNLENLNAAMEQAGFSQTALARELGVSKEAVSKWFSGTKFPRPDKLLRLGLALNLSLDELVNCAENSSEPIIAFRKRGASKTTVTHIAQAKDMGRMLSALVPYLPYDLLVQPATLKNPSKEYGYTQRVAAKIRSEIGVGPEEELSFAHLIKKFNELQAVIIPVLWGKKDKHENALHIYLPESMTTWVYLNLDVEVHDFKFWMAHELAHVHSPDLREDEAEDFADALAGALIFPEPIARAAYHDISRSRTVKTRIAKIRQYADCYSISLLSVYHEINKFAAQYELAEIALGNPIYGANTNFNKQFHTVSQTIFDATLPDANRYINKCVEIFGTPFFDALKSYLMEHGKSVGYIQSILDTPLLDAKGIHAELS